MGQDELSEASGRFRVTGVNTHTNDGGNDPQGPISGQAPSGEGL